MTVLPILKDIKQKLSHYADGVFASHVPIHWSSKMMAVSTLDALYNVIYHFFGTLLVFYNQDFVFCVCCYDQFYGN